MLFSTFAPLITTTIFSVAYLGTALPTVSNSATTTTAIETRDTDVWPASNIQSPGTEFIIEFWVLWWFLSVTTIEELIPLLTYSAYGVPNQCYELSPTSSPYGIDLTKLTGSVKLGSGSSSCTVWRGQGCTGESFAVNTAGISIYDGLLQSFKCVA